MKKLLTTALLLLPLLLPLASAGQALAQKATPTKHPFLWRIEAKDGGRLPVVSFLYGTMHLGDERLVTLPKVVNDARDNCDALYCELAMDAMNSLASKMIKRMTLPRGETLEKLLPDDVKEMLEEELDYYGVPMRLFNKRRPWAMIVLLPQLEAKKQNMLKSLDPMLYREARQDDKEVGGLETGMEQLEALSSGTREEHIARLRDSLESLAKMRRKGESSLEKMLEIYLSGNEVALLDFVEEQTGEDDELNEKFMKRLLEERNVRMADRIAEKLAANPKKKYFFAVGTMHYVGKTGVGTLLEKKGYRIRRVAPPQIRWRRVVKMREELAELRAKVRRLEKKLQKQPR